VSGPNSAAVRFLYGTRPGRLLLKLILGSHVDKIAVWYLRSPLSRPIIGGFARRNGIPLTPEQKKKFKKIVKELRAVDLVSNLDVDALARLVIAMDRYVAITEELNRQPLMLTIQVPSGVKDAEGNPVLEEKEVVNGEVERLLLIQDRCFKQCRQGASDFGLTVSSRCRLMIPKADKEPPKENKFKQKFA